MCGFCGNQLNKALWSALAVVAVGLFGFSSPATAQGMSGDVNLDGEIDVLDVQATIAQALGAAAETAEANVDDNAPVNILDVQIVINTILGEGGLVQTVTGDIPRPKQGAATERMIAVSNGGLFAEGTVDPTTGHFELDLSVKAGWSLALLVDAGAGAEVLVGTVNFPVSDLVSLTVPLPTVVNGNALNIGSLVFSSPATVGQDVVDLLQDVTKPVDTTDADGNGIPDFIEPLLELVRDAPNVPNNPDTSGLHEAVAACLAGLEGLEEPDLTDANENGVPDFIEPVLACLREVLEQWLESLGIPVPPGDSDGNGVPDFVDGIVSRVEDGVSDWLGSLGSPLLVDENGNGIPDPIEDLLSVPGIPSPIDSDGNGIPDFAEDSNDNGITNIVDPDCVIPGDADCDGIPDVADLDDDNDGIPDYAEAK